MLVFDLLLVLAGLCGLVAAVLWVRVASSHSLNQASMLDGTGRLTERSNRRARRAALVASGICLLLAAAACLAGRGAEVF